MSSSTLIRLGGLAAIIAGLLRGVASVLPDSIPTVELELFYVFTDVFILFGLMGLYCFQHEEVGVWGFIGFLTATLGIGSLIGPDGEIARVSMYAAGASFFAIGLTILSFGVYKAKKLPGWIPLLWITSTIAGFIGYFAKDYSLLFVISGIMLGVGYSSAGLIIWTTPTSSRSKHETIHPG
jgi:hypothetical protein